MLRTLVLALALFAMPSAAQTLETPQFWLLLTGTGKLENGVRWYGEVQPRANLPTRDVERLLVRGAVGYQIGEKTSAWLGYAWTPLISPRFADEQRPFFQFLIEDSLGSVKLLNRSRLETRFIAGGPPVSVRGRHMFRVVAPIAGGVNFAAYDELFVNFVNTMGLDQNRLFAGLNYGVTKNLTVEAGYIHNYIWRPALSSDRVNHVALLWLAYTM